MGKIGILALTALSVLMAGCSQPADEVKGTLQTDPGREYVIVVRLDDWRQCLVGRW